MINITVAFTENVTVAGGSPLLELATGAVNRSAAYEGGSGTAGLAFRYTVQAGDKTGDLDYAGAGALSLNGSTVRDAAGNDAVLTLPMPGGPGSLANSSDIMIDAAAKAQPQTATLRASIVAADQQQRPAGPAAPVVQPSGQFFGGSGGGGGGGGGGGARLAPDGGGGVVLYGAAWDCDEGTIRITVNDGVRPEVSVLSSEGTAAAQRGDGPHPAGRAVYEAPLPGDPILSIRAVLAEGRAVSMATEAVRTDGQCTGEKVFRQYGDGADGAAQPRPQEPPAGLPGEPDDARQDEPPAGLPGEPDDARQDEPPAGLPGEPRQDSPIEIPPPPPEPPADRPDAAQPPAAQQGAEPGTGAAPPAEDDEGGCLIATAAHGTELAPQVQFLREVRDNTLLTTESGRAFMSAFGAAYYSFSPQVADLERAHPALRQAVAALVAPMLHALSVVGAAEPGSEHGVAAYGALAISLVAGMYVAAPAAGAWYAARIYRGRGRSGGRAGMPGA